MYDELVKELRASAAWADRLALLMGRAEDDTHAPIMRKAADAIEELNAKFVAEHELRVKALNRLCSWCGVCSKENRNAIGCDDIAQLDEANAPRWISAEERLPEEYKDVLCYYEYFRYGEYNCMWRTIDRGYYGHGIWSGEAGQGHRNKVLYWMPLPEPPKDE